MPQLIIGDGTYLVTLTNDDPEITYTSEQFVELDAFYGTNTAQNIDLKCFTDLITITAKITDVTKFNDLIFMKNSNEGVYFYWNQDETYAPLLDHVTENGEVSVTIITVSLHQAAGTPANQYDLIIKMGTNVVLS